MRNINRPSDGSNSPLLFDDDEYTWWATQMHPSALKRLDEGFEGLFRRSLLQLMPVEQVAKHFTEDTGRPTKELYSMAGLILIAEFRNYTVEETANAYTFDSSIQYALDIPRDRQYVCPKTIDNYRRIFREDDLGQKVFLDVTAALVTELNIDIKKQRCDSTHVLSNMAIFSRYQLIATAAKRFLNAVKKLNIEEFEAIDESLRKRYEASDQRLYFGEVVNPSKVTKEEKATILSQIGEDLNFLISRFSENEDFVGLEAYEMMKQIFHEHFEIEFEHVSVEAPEVKSSSSDDDGNSDQGQPTIKTRKCSVATDGTRANTIQNSSDPDAGYCGHKGEGYQAQLTQTLPPKDKKGEVEGPGLITGLIAESAGNFDGHALIPLLEQQKSNGMLPEEMTADTHYGSDENVCAAKDQFGVEIVSPVSGASQYPERKESDKPEPKPGTQAADFKAKKERLDKRRECQLTDEWKKQYAPRSGIEGLNRALDLKTGFKNLRVRGLKSVGMCLHLKAAGWNILSAAKIIAKRARKAAFLIFKLVCRQQLVTMNCGSQ